MSLSCALEKSRFVSPKEFPLAILVKMAGYVIKWFLWNSSAKRCDRLKSFVPLSRSIRTKPKPIATCSGSSFFPRLVRSLNSGFEFWLVDFNSGALVNQSQIKPKPITTCLGSFFLFTTLSSNNTKEFWLLDTNFSAYCDWFLQITVKTKKS